MPLHFFFGAPFANQTRQSRQTTPSFFGMSKRGRIGAAAMHEKMVTAFRSLSRHCAVEMSSGLTTRSVTGYENPKKGSMMATAYEFKGLYPHRIILVRSGEAYEAFGVDATIILECDSTMERSGKSNDPRLHFHASRIQLVINQLLRCDFEIAVFEESEVLCTPRHRYLSQIVTAAYPAYAFTGNADVDSTPKAKKVAALWMHENGRATVCLLDVTQRICQRLDDVDIVRAMPLVKAAIRPVYVVRHRPAWLASDETVLLGADPHADVAQRLIQTIGREMKVDPGEFTAVRVQPARCAPLTSFTLQQLGLFGDMNVPCLGEYCLPRGARASVRHKLYDWLAAPPSEKIAAANRHIMCQLRASSRPVPAFDVVSTGRRQRALQTSRIDASGLLSIRANAQALMAVDLDARGLIEAIAEERGCARVTMSELIDVVHIIDRTMRASPYEGRDARGISYRLDTLVVAAHEAFDSTNKTLREIIGRWDDRELVYDARGVALRGRPDDKQKLPVHDRANRTVPNQYTTRELQAAERAVADALQTILDNDRCATRACAQELHQMLPFVGLVEDAALHLATLIEHARVVTTKRWNPLENGCGINVRGLVPYWMDPQSTVLNQVTVEDGAIVVLTAPNGGGKTTLLRAIAACVLLHQCGLSAPCAAGSVAPTIDHLFVRAGGLDAALERRSSFSSEMHDLRTMLGAEGVVVALVDEPCNSTSGDEAARLLKAVMEHIPGQTTFVLSTHHHDLEAPSVERVTRLQMGAQVVGDDCVPNFRLKPGTCTNSMALQVALAVGIPIDIVRSARRTDDVETLILVQLRLHNVTFEKVVSGTRPPPSFHSTLYIVDTEQGVYVGESDRMLKRLEAHVREKPPIRCVYVASCNNKTVARELETALINELRFHDIMLLSDADGAHGF